MSLPKLAEIVKPLNAESVHGIPGRPVTFKWFVESVYFPFCRRRWKESTVQSNEQRIKKHLISEFGDKDPGSFRRDDLQQLLDRKSLSGLSYSVVNHLRWDLRSLFEFAVEEEAIGRNPAKLLFTPELPSQHHQPKLVFSDKEVIRILSVLDLRERLVVKMAVLAGMRPGEIFGLRWSDMHGTYAEVCRRIFHGKVSSPKSRRGIRRVAFSPGLVRDLEEWKSISLDTGSEAWVFPSEKLTTPLGKDNVWRRHIEPKLSTIGLTWGTFQVMRRTHATAARKIGLDPKVIADQLGHGLGVNLDVYTQTEVETKLDAVTGLEAELSKNGASLS